MKLVLLSGGSGKRLWPLSNDSRSKQFLKVLPDGQGGLESMVQRVWRQLGEAGLAPDASIATGRGQLDMIQSQIGPEASVIIEPERRDTFPAIALAAVYLYSIEGVSLQEVVTVLPVDPYVEQSFFHTLRKLEAAALEPGTELALMGVAPTYPSEKYGYVVPHQNAAPSEKGWAPVSHFAEKPSREKAEQLIAGNALWNCGVFAFKLDYMIRLLMKLGLPIHYEELMRQYNRLPKISFDYAVVEKARSLVVIPYEGEWKDLGTWNTLTEEIKTPQIGKGHICGESDGVHLINELDIPVAVLGLSNVIVSASPDGILVADKNASPRVKELLQDMDQRPMYEERRWGYYRVLDYKKLPEGQEVLTKRICIAPGRNLSYQFHSKRSEVWTVIAGTGEYILNDVIGTLQPGDVVRIPVYARHSVRAITELEIIEVQLGSELVENDIERLALTWEEMAGLCQ